MTERQVEERLRAWYRSLPADPPDSLALTVAGVPGEERLASPRRPSLRHLAVALAVVLLISVIAVGGATLGMLLRDRLPVVPDRLAPDPEHALHVPRLEGQFDACRALSPDALERLFGDAAAMATPGGPGLAAATGDWAADVLGNPIRSCLYEVGGARIAVHIPMESTRIGEASLIARRFLGPEYSDDAWPWSAEKPDGSAALILTRSSAEAAGYLIGVTMRLGPEVRPALSDIAIEIVNGLNPLLAIPDACDLLARAAEPSTAVMGAAADAGWVSCTAEAGTHPASPQVLVYDRFTPRERTASLVSDRPWVPHVGPLTALGHRWSMDDDASGVHAVAVSCEPVAFVTTASSAEEASALADRVAQLACPAGTGEGGAR